MQKQISDSEFAEIVAKFGNVTREQATAIALNMKSARVRADKPAKKQTDKPVKAGEHLDADEVLSKKFKNPLETFQNKAKNQKPLPFDELAMSISEVELDEVRLRFGPLPHFGAVAKAILALDPKETSTVAYNLWKYGCELSALNPKQPKMAELWDTDPCGFKTRFLAEPKVSQVSRPVAAKPLSIRDLIDLLFLWMLAIPRLVWYIRVFNLAKELQVRQNELENLKLRREIHKLPEYKALKRVIKTTT